MSTMSDLDLVIKELYTAAKSTIGAADGLKEFYMKGDEPPQELSMETAKLKEIENRYGSFTFRFGITHLIDTGKKHYTEANIDEWIKEIDEQGKKDKENGVHRLMTADFEYEAVRCAAELSKLEIWDTLRYITRFVDVGLAIAKE